MCTPPTSSHYDECILTRWQRRSVRYRAYLYPPIGLERYGIEPQPGPTCEVKDCTSICKNGVCQSCQQRAIERMAHMKTQHNNFEHYMKSFEAEMELKNFRYASRLAKPTELQNTYLSYFELRPSTEYPGINGVFCSQQPISTMSVNTLWGYTL